MPSKWGQSYLCKWLQNWGQSVYFVLPLCMSEKNDSAMLNNYYSYHAVVANVTVHRKRGYQGYFIKIEFFAQSYPLPYRKYVSMIFKARQTPL